MQVIAIRYVTYSKALCESKKNLGDRIRKLEESLGLVTATKHPVSNETANLKVTGSV